MATWYIQNGDTTKGPYSAVQLRELVRNGELLQSDHVRSEKTNGWIKAGSLKGLFENVTTPIAHTEATSATPPPEQAPIVRTEAVESVHETAVSTNHYWEFLAHSFTEWYDAKPMSKLAFRIQLLIWIAFGFLWIPIFFVISTVPHSAKLVGLSMLLALPAWVIWGNFQDLLFGYFFFATAIVFLFWLFQRPLEIPRDNKLYFIVVTVISLVGIAVGGPQYLFHLAIAGTVIAILGCYIHFEWLKQRIGRVAVAGVGVLMMLGGLEPPSQIETPPAVDSARLDRIYDDRDETNNNHKLVAKTSESSTDVTQKARSDNDTAKGRHLVTDKPIASSAEFRLDRFIFNDMTPVNGQRITEAFFPCKQGMQTIVGQIVEIDSDTRYEQLFLRKFVEDGVLEQICLRSADYFKDKLVGTQQQDQRSQNEELDYLDKRFRVITVNNSISIEDNVIKLGATTNDSWTVNNPESRQQYSKYTVIDFFKPTIDTSGDSIIVMIQKEEYHPKLGEPCYRQLLIYGKGAGFLASKGWNIYAKGEEHLTVEEFAIELLTVLPKRSSDFWTKRPRRDRPSSTVRTIEVSMRRDLDESTDYYNKAVRDASCEITEGGIRLSWAFDMQSIPEHYRRSTLKRRLVVLICDSNGECLAHYISKEAFCYDVARIPTKPKPLNGVSELGDKDSLLLPLKQYGNEILVPVKDDDLMRTYRVSVTFVYDEN